MMKHLIIYNFKSSSTIFKLTIEKCIRRGENILINPKHSEIVETNFSPNLGGLFKFGT